MSKQRDLDDWELQSVRIGIALQLSQKALMVIGKEHGLKRLAALEEEFVTSAKNMDIEGVSPDQEALIYREAITIIRSTFAHTRERLAAG